MAAPTNLPNITPARTIHDVEAELNAARYAQRRGPARRRPDDITLRDVTVNALLDEWAYMHSGLHALDFPAPDNDEQPTVTHIGGGPLDADLD